MSQTPKGFLNRQTRIRVQIEGVPCVGNRQVAALQKPPNNLFGDVLHEGMVVKLVNGGAGIIHKLIEPDTKLNGIPMSSHKGGVDDGDEGGDRSRKGRHPSWKEESKKEERRVERCGRTAGGQILNGRKRVSIFLSFSIKIERECVNDWLKGSLRLSYTSNTVPSNVCFHSFFRDAVWRCFHGKT